MFFKKLRSVIILWVKVNLKLLASYPVVDTEPVWVKPYLVYVIVATIVLAGITLNILSGMVAYIVVAFSSIPLIQI